MKIGNASGSQIAFFTFALLLTIVPVSNWLEAAHPWTREEARLLGTVLPFLVMIAVLGAFPRLRKLCAAELARPVPVDRRAEVIAVSIASLTKAFAWAGLWVSYWWLVEGAWAVEQRLRLLEPHDSQMARASTLAGWLRAIVLAGFVAPVIEELVFRCFLYRAWEERWGWIVSTLLTSTLFGLYHPNFIPAFTMSVLYVCLYRRTGSLWAPIAAHSLFNIAAFHPFLGQLHFRNTHPPTGDLGVWGPQLACMLFVAVAVPAYLWLSRDAHARLRPAQDGNA